MGMKTAIIIGATSGIGRELAVRLAQDGWKVGAAGRRGERLEELQAQFPAGIICTQVLDITKADATQALDALLQKTGAPDLFLHVSGVGRQNPLLDESIEIKVIDTNCSGMVRTVSHFINYVKDSKAFDEHHKAHIGVVTSVAGTAGMGISAAYSASKKMQSTYITAMVQLSRMEHLPIIFSDIRPGFVATDILDPIHHYPLLMTVDEAATHILKGLRRRRRIITFDWRFRVLTALWRLIPRCLWERFTFIKTD